MKTNSVLAVRNGAAKTVRIAERSSDSTTAIVSGLPAGTRVIVDGTSSVSDGDKVTVRE